MLYALCSMLDARCSTLYAQGELSVGKGQLAMLLLSNDASTA
jgi:hypothetical protein